MHLRILFALLFTLSLPLVLWADGLAFGKGFSPQLMETHQLAVIHLTESTADVSMFIAIEGIPAGEEITYILPFWYKPEDFSLTEENTRSFRNSYVAPAHAKVKEIQRISARLGSKALLSTAPFVGVSIPTIIFFPTFSSSGVKGRGAAQSATLTPYATDETAHARAELYRIGENDLQLLIQQSGLPEKYLQPLKKYRTPYFAVMRLKGLTKTENNNNEISGRGIRYHFTHQISGGRYTYPLGTGAAWPQPIPITEVYITCPERLAMNIKAPTEGEKLHYRRFSGLVYWVTKYLAMSPVERRQFTASDSDHDTKDFLSPKTSSFLGTEAKRPFAWHIAYLQSNPDQDISVQISKQFAPWRFMIADFFIIPGVPLTACIILSLLSWLATIMLCIRKRWQRAGKSGSLLMHSLATFFKAQFIAPIIISGVAVVVMGINTVVESYSPSQIWVYISLIIILAGSVTLAAFLEKRYAAPDWRKWLTLTSWLYSALFFAVTFTLLYGFLYWCETI